MKQKGDVVWFDRQAYVKHIGRYGMSPSDYVGMEDLEEGEYAILDVRGSQDEYYYELRPGVYVHPIWCRNPFQK